MSARVTFAILFSTRIISAFPAVTVAAVVLTVGSLTAPLRLDTAESLPETVSTFSSAIFTLPNVAMLAVSMFSFTLSTEVLAPLTAPNVFSAESVSVVFAAAFKAIVLSAECFIVQPIVVSTGAAMLVTAVVSVPVPFIVMLFAVLGRTNFGSVTLVLSVSV